MASTKEKLQILKTLHSQQEALYSEKNEKYDDAFGKTFSEYGPTVAIIRLEDKLNRVKALVRAGLDDSNGESLVDTLTDLANYSNMFLIELGATSTSLEEKPKKKRKKSKDKDKATAAVEKAEAQEKGPLDDLTKKQLIKIISELGGTAHPKSNREKLISTINSFPKAKVAVAITSLKSSVAEVPEEETEDGEEE